jgi:hypothetical protein
MRGLQALQSVRYVSVQDKRYAVVEEDDWEALIEWLETQEDFQVFRQAQAELEAAGNDPTKAGWLRWDDIRDELAE